MVEPKAFQDALLAYYARPCDAEGEAVRAAVLATLPRCKCGQPRVLNTVHRENTPCYRAADPADGLGVKECRECRQTGLTHCQHPDECGGPWTTPVAGVARLDGSKQ